jgi:hypothetical protein
MHSQLEVDAPEDVQKATKLVRASAGYTTGPIGSPFFVVGWTALVLGLAALVLGVDVVAGCSGVALAAFSVVVCGAVLELVALGPVAWLTAGVLALPVALVMVFVLVVVEPQPPATTARAASGQMAKPCRFSIGEAY